MKRNYLLLFISLLSFFSHAQHYDIKLYGVAEGMLHSQINCVHSDSRGFLWFGTWIGLSRYDGHEYVNYDDKDGLSDTHIYSILEDKEGNLWCSSRGGIHKFDGQTFTNYGEESFPVGGIIQLYFNRDTTEMWIVGGTQGVTLVTNFNETPSFKNFKAKQGLVNNHVQQVDFDDNGAAWLSSRQLNSNRQVSNHGGVSVIKYGKVTETFTIDQGLPHNSVNTICCAPDGSVWASTYKGIVRINKDKSVDVFSFKDVFGFQVPQKGIGAVFLKHDPSGYLWFGYGYWWGDVSCMLLARKGKSEEVFDRFLARNSSAPRKLMVDRRKNLWFLGNSSLSKYDHNKEYREIVVEGARYKEIKSISNINGMPNAGIASEYSATMDREDNIWVTFDGVGAIKYSDNGFTQFSKKDGLPEKSAWAVMELEDGKMLLGSKGITLYDGHQLKPYNTGVEELPGRVYSMMKDSADVVWIGHSSARLTVLDNGPFKNVNPTEGWDIMNAGGLFDMHQDHNGKVWFASFNAGIYTYDGEVWEQFHYNLDSNMYKGHMALAIEPGHGRDLWFSSNQWLIRWNGKSFDHVSRDEFLGGPVVTLQWDPNHDQLWVGSWAGLSRIKVLNDSPFEYEIHNYSPENTNLANDIFYLLEMDEEGNIWAGHAIGVDKITIDQDGEIASIRNYGVDEGFWPIETNQNSSCLDSKGNLWFGTIDGFMRYNPSEGKDLQPAPKVHITDILLDFKHPNWDSLGSSELNFFGFPDQPNLQYEHNQITISFTGINYTSPSKVRFQHRLVRDGEDAIWSPESEIREASYSNLAAGEYDFQVKAVNGDGVWSEITHYKFTIQPPFWQTTTFYLLCALTLAILIYLLIKAREKKLQKDKRVLEEQVKLRTEELEVAYDEIAEKNEDIMGSITYARRIQNAILPTDESMSAALKDNFVLYMPKDIVAGDFYWMEEEHGNVYFSAADCTGHGVPGAMVSVMCSSALTKAVKELNKVETGEILDETVKVLESTLAKGGEQLKDGMDLALCSIDRDFKTLKYSGANNPLYLIRDGELMEIKADKQPVGHYDDRKPYTTHTVELQKGDLIYLSSDGYADQFGGEKGKKMKYKPFKQLLIRIHTLDMQEQQRILQEEFEKWRGDFEQVDDVCVLGIRI